ncbi:MAG: sortase [Acidimicrobiia bacterium]
MVRGVGKALIAGGTLLLLFVAYLLWGTGLHEARAQRSLKADFERSLAAQAPSPSPTTGTTGTTGATTTTTYPPPTPTGEAVAVIRIPKIGVEKAVVEGVGLPDLKKGPGHYPDTPLPGQPGNAGIAGHRTTYGAPFFELDQLAEGDEILVTTLQGEHRFVVDRTQVVKPSQTEVLDPTTESRLTITTCHPRFSSRQRLVVSAVLVGDPAPAPPVVEPSAGGELPGEAPAGVASLDDPAGLSGESAARTPAVVWGLTCALLALAVHLLARRWRRWPAYLAGAVPVGVTLFAFFENVSRLLPSNF